MSLKCWFRTISNDNRFTSLLHFQKSETYTSIVVYSARMIKGWGFHNTVDNKFFEKAKTLIRPLIKVNAQMK